MSAPQIPGRLLGNLERADRGALSGWATNERAPGTKAELELFIDGVSAGPIPCTMYRPDLHQAGLGDGWLGFFLFMPKGISAFADHVVSIRRMGDGAELPGSPRTIPRTPETELGATHAIEDAIAGAAATASGAELDALIRDLARIAAGLLFEEGSAVAEPQMALIRRWSTVAWPDARHGDGPRALFIDERIPDRDRDAGSSAAISHMRALQLLGFRVDFVAAAALDRDDARMSALEACGITCWHAPWVGSIEEVLRDLGSGLDLAYLHRLTVMQHYGGLVRRWCPGARLLYCVADLHHVRRVRQLSVETGRPLDDPGMMAEVAALRTAELLAVQAADAAITHSSFEAALLTREAPGASVHLVPWDVPAHPIDVAASRRLGVAFVGSYGHAPNLDAAEFLLAAIMPLVWSHDPTIPCVLAGSDMPATLRAAADRAPAGMVTALGHVPAIDDVWRRVRLSVAPLRYGAGLKGKVLDSLARGIPCVCSPMAAEGMDLPLELRPLIADTPEAMAQTIVQLHNDAAVLRRLAHDGLHWVAQTLSQSRVTEALRGAAGFPL